MSNEFKKTGSVWANNQPIDVNLRIISWNDSSPRIWYREFHI